MCVCARACVCLTSTQLHFKQEVMEVESQYNTMSCAHSLNNVNACQLRYMTLC